VRIHSPADYDALDFGQHYIAPDGMEHIKQEP
jgi:hypothetical protein